MAASRNEATGDVLANVKGSADKYAEGWDRIFGKPQPEPEAEPKEDPLTSAES